LYGTFAFTPCLTDNRSTTTTRSRTHGTIPALPQQVLDFVEQWHVDWNPQLSPACRQAVVELQATPTPAAKAARHMLQGSTAASRSIRGPAYVMWCVHHTV
jgi:hypothetical protein